MRTLSNFINQFYIIPIIIACLIGASACENSLLDSPGSGKSEAAGDSITIIGSINVPEMTKVTSRGAMGESSSPDLKLTILEFDYVAGNSMASFLTNVYKAELITNSEPNSDGNVAFKVTLKSTKNKKVLHFLLAGDYFEIPESEFGSEASILPSITVRGPENGDMPSDGYPEAYWGKVVFKNGYDNNPNTSTGKSPLEESLTNVSMIRNFAKISVVVADGLKEKFRLGEFFLINEPTAGTVVPWIRSTLETPELLEVGEDGEYQMKEYNDITYRGILPGEISFRSDEEEEEEFPMLYAEGVSPYRYMYEHPYEPSRPTSIIIKGEYNMGSVGEMDMRMRSDDVVWETVYYKIDIGKLDGDGNFNYFNIIRNIHYIINITDVNGAGEYSFEDAANGYAFNNISATTDTESMLSMSDGKNLIMTNRLNYIIVNDEPIEFMYRYLQGIDDGEGDVNNDINVVKPVGLEPGDVIDKVSGPDYDTNPGWVTYIINPNEPTDEVKTQEFTVVGENGLGRTIHLMLRNPWQYIPVYNIKNNTAWVANGISNSPPVPMGDDGPVVSSERGKPITVYFNLPDKLPEAMFPLEFQVESKHQWIENNPIGTLVVTSGPSLFLDRGITISYIKKVSYDEYMHPYKDNDTNEVDFDRINIDHTIRCRFRTIVAAEGNAEIRIHCPYFAPDASVIFERGGEASDIQ